MSGESNISEKMTAFVNTLFCDVFHRIKYMYVYTHFRDVVNICSVNDSAKMTAFVNISRLITPQPVKPWWAVCQSQCELLDHFPLTVPLTSICD